MIGIIGGGCGGLFAARALARAGFRVTVFEPDPSADGLSVEEAFTTWQRPYVPQLRQPHSARSVLRKLMLARDPELYEAVLAGGMREWKFQLHGVGTEPHDPDLGVRSAAVSVLGRRPRVEPSAVGVRLRRGRLGGDQGDERALRRRLLLRGSRPARRPHRRGRPPGGDPGRPGLRRLRPRRLRPGDQRTTPRDAQWDSGAHQAHGAGGPGGRPPGRREAGRGEEAGAVSRADRRPAGRRTSGGTAVGPRGRRRPRRRRRGECRRAGCRARPCRCGGRCPSQDCS